MLWQILCYNFFFFGNDDGTIFVQSLENRPHVKLKFLDFAVKKMLFTIVEDVLIAYDKKCIVMVCTRSLILIEKYDIEDITNVSVLDDFEVEEVLEMIKIPRFLCME